MSAALVQKLSSIPGVHVREEAGVLTLEPVTEHDLIQALTALRQADTKLQLSLSRMARIGSFNDASLTLPCDAGVPLPELEAVANRANATLGLLSPGALKLTVGEFLEGPYGGLRAIPGGRLEPLSTGLRVVTPDALLTTSHTSPRSATGPDLDALHLGGARRFGIITHATVRLFPRTSTSQRASFSFATAPALIRAVIASVQDGVLISRAVVESRAERFLVTMQLHGSAESIERDLATLGHRATDAQGRGAAAGRDDVERVGPERAMQWREIRAALEAGESFDLWRISADGAIAHGSTVGRALVPGADWPLFSALGDVASVIDVFGVMRILS